MYTKFVVCLSHCMALCKLHEIGMTNSNLHLLARCYTKKMLILMFRTPTFPPTPPNFTIVTLYVDILVLIFNHKLIYLIEAKSVSFKMIDNIDVQYCLGIQFKRNRNNHTIFLSQQKYIFDTICFSIS